MRRFVAGALLLGLVIAVNSNVWAGGGQAYPLGAEASFIGAAPPPGFTFINYVNYYNAGDLKDSSGDDVPIFDNVSTVAEVMRLIWFSNKTILGANYGQHFFLPIVSVDIDFKVPVGPKLRSHYSDTNIPYFIYSPFLLGWHTMGGTLHFVLDIADIYIPLYNEDKGNLASVGRNFWTFEPVFAVTWMPTKALEMSAKLMYDFNTKQSDSPLPTGHLVDRIPGQEFHFDYGVSYALVDNFRVTLSGYFHQQVTDDDFDLDGFSPAERALLSGFEDDRSRVFAIGPGVWYQHKNMFFTVRSQFEAAAENKSEGYSLWFKFIYGF